MVDTSVKIDDLVVGETYEVEVNTGVKYVGKYNGLKRGEAKVYSLLFSNKHQTLSLPTRSVREIQKAQCKGR